MSAPDALSILDVLRLVSLTAALVLIASPGPPPASSTVPRSGEAGIAGLRLPPRDAPSPAAVLIGAGDICVTGRRDAAAATARLIDTAPTAHVFTLGDDSNEAGTAEQYADCYGPTWGRSLPRTSAAVGNHDYVADRGQSYFAYFGPAAGPPGLGYYSYDLGAWHVVVLNGECAAVGGCGAGSPQERWLRRDLEDHPSLCTLAYWHEPRFSSGRRGQASDPRSQAFWEALYSSGAEIVMNGHAHDYERFAPQTPSGVASDTGIREFVVGTGGAAQLPFGRLAPNSEVRRSGALGVLRLELSDSGYAWRFISATRGSFTDAGVGTCHGRPASS